MIISFLDSGCLGVLHDFYNFIKFQHFCLHIGWFSAGLTQPISCFNYLLRTGCEVGGLHKICIVDLLWITNI